MIVQELFEKYPKTADAIVKSYSETFVKSLENTNTPEEFKEFARQQQIDHEYVMDFIEGNPRGTFDFFDENKVYIQISVDVENKCFRYTFDGGKVESNDYDTRKEAEAAAVEKAFEILNEKL
jgi:hypothetical protein